MKAIVAILLVLILSSPLWTQGIECVWMTSVQDYNCLDTNCGVQTFTVPCDGLYCMNCEIVWKGGGDPNDCKVEAKLKRDSDNVVIWTCRNWDEEPGYCYPSPIENCFTLQKNVTYKLWVCFLGSCPGETCDCTHCFAQSSIWWVHV